MVVASLKLVLLKLLLGLDEDSSRLLFSRSDLFGRQSQVLRSNLESVGFMACHG